MGIVPESIERLLKTKLPEDRIKLFGWIEASWFRKCNLLYDSSSWLKFPNDVQFFAQAVVFDRG